MDLDTKILFYMYLLVLALGIGEYFFHLRNLRKIKIRIHVNGTRGKSTVTRLIAAGLRESGLKTVAKTTGTQARFIFEDGTEEPIIRRRRVNINEQIGIVRRAANRGADVLVVECMALNPENQWVAEHRLIKSTIRVITNVTDDHLDVMGPTVDDVARALSRTIPKKGHFVTETGPYYEMFESIAGKMKTKVHSGDPSTVTDEEKDSFDYVSFKQNIATALKVCEILGVNRDIALKGMIAAKGDPGVMRIIELDNIIFAGAFAANDAASTIATWNVFMDTPNVKDMKKVVIINNRRDRVQRIEEIAEVVVNSIEPDAIVLVGSCSRISTRYINSYVAKKSEDQYSPKIIDLTAYKEVDKIATKTKAVFDNDKIAVFGVGNTKIIGEKIMQYFEENGVRI